MSRVLVRTIVKGRHRVTVLPLDDVGKTRTDHFTDNWPIFHRRLPLCRDENQFARDATSRVAIPPLSTSPLARPDRKPLQLRHHRQKHPSFRSRSITLPPTLFLVFPRPRRPKPSIIATGPWWRDCWSLLSERARSSIAGHCTRRSRLFESLLLSFWGIVPYFL